MPMTQVTMHPNFEARVITQAMGNFLQGPPHPDPRQTLGGGAKIISIRSWVTKISVPNVILVSNAIWAENN